LLILRPDFLVVADVLTSNDGQDHVFDWMYHNLGDKISSDAANQASEAPAGQGFEYIQDICTGITDGIIRATVSMGEDKAQITVNDEVGSQVLIGTGVGESVLERVPLIYVTRNGQKAFFAVVIEPVSGEGQVKAVRFEKHKTSGYLIRIQLNDEGEELYSYDPDGNARKIEGIETRSKLLCLRREKGEVYKVLADSEL
jgi:hypothetical protein